MARHNFVNLIPVALNYYPIMFSIDNEKNIQKYVFLSETKASMLKYLIW